MTIATPTREESVPWDTLRAGLEGSTLLRDDTGYDEARRVWNGMIDRFPAAIVQARNTNDVVVAVRFAREHDLPISVRGGGHNAAGLAVIDAGLVIDLSPMNAVEVDPDKRIARAGGGATWGDFDAATQAYGLATTGGAISMTGIGGLTLGGGLGYLMRLYGLAADNLIGAEVVLADGSVVRTSERERPELLWGLRGGGGNFGVVTEFEFQLHPVDTMYAGMLLHPRDRAREAFQVYREQTALAPDQLTTFFGLLNAPDGAPVCGFVIAYAGDAESGQQAVQGMRNFAQPMADLVGPMPYLALQQMMDEAFQPGPHVYWKSHFLTGLTDELIDLLIAGANAAPSPMNAVLIEQFGGAVARVGQDETAFDHRNADYNLAIIARWLDPADAEANINWARSLWDVVKPFARGAYVNYLGVGDEPARVRDAYSPVKYARLVALKQQYDPENVFRSNQNITPDAAPVP